MSSVRCFAQRFLSQLSLVAFLLVPLTLAAPLLAAEEQVVVRGGEHAGFGRLVFDWEKPVEYETKVSGGYLEVRFDRPVAFDLSPLQRDLEGYLSGAKVSEDRRSVVFTLKGGFGLKAFRLDEKVVIDLLDKPTEAVDAAPAPAVKSPPPEPERAPRRTTAGALASSEVKPEASAPTKPTSAKPASGKPTQAAALQDTGEQASGSREVGVPPLPPSSAKQWVPPPRVRTQSAAAPLDSSGPLASPDPLASADLSTASSTTPAAEATATPDEPETPQSGAAAESAAAESLPPLSVRPGSTPALEAESSDSERVSDPAAVAENPAVQDPVAQDPAVQDPAAPTNLLPAAYQARLAALPEEQAPEEQAPEEQASDDLAPVAENPVAENPAVESPAAKPADDPAGQADPAKAEAELAKPAEMPKADEAGKAVETAIALTPDERKSAAAERAAEQAGRDGEAAQKPEEAAPPRVAEAASKKSPADKAAAEESSFSDSDVVPMTGPLGQKEKAVALRFNWAKPTAAAVFRRGDRVWLVFDRPTKPGLAERIGKVAPELSPSALESSSGTIIRLNASHRLSPLLRAEEDSWVLDLRVRDEEAGSAMTLVLDSKASPPKAMIPVREPGRLQGFVDPDLGDLLYVMPVYNEDNGFQQAHDFPEFTILASRQGVVVRPKSEAIRVTLVGKTLNLTSVDGLLLSATPPRDAVDTASRLTPARRLFDLEAWRRGGRESFSDNRHELQNAVLEADQQSRGLARLNLARFFFAQGFTTEALGVLALIDDDDPQLARDPQTLLLRGASYVMVGKYDEAAELLSNPALTGEVEADIWRGALAAASRDWGYAANAFERAAPLIATYPPLMRSRLLLLAAESEIETGDGPSASLFLTQIRDGNADSSVRARVEFLEGRRLLLEDDQTAAKRHLKAAVESGDREAESRARLQLIDLAQAEGEMTPAQAIEELEQLRSGWRGDAFEFALMERIGKLQIQEGQYREGLRTFKQAVSALPDSPDAEKVAERMREVFKDLFIGDYAKDTSALKALALYEEFRELTPSGEDGDAVIQDLAERLAEVDLLDEASALLRRQVEFRLKGEEAARIGARIAELELANKKPDAALEALAMSRSDEPIAVDLIQERRFLRAQALSDGGKPEAALALLEGDESDEARRLRVAIRWDEQDWPGLARALEDLLPEELPADEAPDADTGKLVTALAMAYSMAEDRAGLSDLDWRFADAMALSPEKSTFEMLVSDLDNGLITSVAGEMKGVTLIQDFLKDYWNRRQARAEGQDPNATQTAEAN